MAGHSHASNVRIKKEKGDAKRTKLFTKLGKKIQSVAKENPNPETNSRLFAMLKSARAMGLPKDNIEKALKSAAGDKDGKVLESFEIEARVLGVALIIQAQTDNRNRTASELRQIIKKFGGLVLNPKEAKFMFEPKGIVEYAYREDEDMGIQESRLLEIIMEAGADDLVLRGDQFHVLIEPKNFAEVSNNLIESLGTVSDNYLGYVSKGELVQLDEESFERFNKLLEELEDNDDVDLVSHNADIY